MIDDSMALQRRPHSAISSIASGCAAAQPEAIEDMAEWGRRCKAIESSIMTLEERWMELSTWIESAELP